MYIREDRPAKGMYVRSPSVERGHWEPGGAPAPPYATPGLAQAICVKHSWREKESPHTFDMPLPSEPTDDRKGCFDSWCRASEEVGCKIASSRPPVFLCSWVMPGTCEEAHRSGISAKGLRFARQACAKVRNDLRICPPCHAQVCPFVQC